MMADSSASYNSERASLSQEVIRRLSNSHRSLGIEEELRILNSINRSGYNVKQRKESATTCLRGGVAMVKAKNNGKIPLHRWLSHSIESRNNKKAYN